MSIGPVQLLVIGFSQPDFEGEIAQELVRLRGADTIKVIDAMVVYKDADGSLSATHLDTLTDEDRVRYGATLGALIGLGFEGEEGVRRPARCSAQRRPPKASTSSRRTPTGTSWRASPTTARRR